MSITLVGGFSSKFTGLTSIVLFNNRVLSLAVTTKCRRLQHLRNKDKISISSQSNTGQYNKLL